MKRREAVGGRNNHQIYKRMTAAGKVRYEVYYKDALGQHFDCKDESGNHFATLGAAQAYRDRKVGKKAEGHAIVTTPKLTFRQAREAWWKAYVAGLKPKTQESYGCSVKHLSVAFDNYKLTDITPTEVAAYITDKNKTLKGWTIRSHQVALSSIFNYAARHLDYRGANPLVALESKERASIEDKKEQRSLTTEELDRLLNAVEEPYKLLFQVAARTGGRLSEILGLTWESVDLKNGTIFFTHQLQKVDGKLKRVKLKTKRSQRRMRIGPETISALREHKAAQGKSQDHDYVFCSRMGTPLDHRNVGGRVMARAVKLAGLEDIEVNGEVVRPAPTFHSLRHTHGSHLIARGWDVARVSARLGHADSTTTLRCYVHEFADQALDERHDRDLMEMESPSRRVNGLEIGTDSSAGSQASPQTAEIIPMQGISSS